MSDKDELAKFIADTIRQELVLESLPESVIRDPVFRKRRPPQTKKTVKYILGILFATFTEGFYNLPPPKIDSPPSPPPPPPPPPSPPSPPPPSPPTPPSPPSPSSPTPPSSPSPPASPGTPPPPPRPPTPDPPPTCRYVLVYRGGYQTIYTDTNVYQDLPNEYRTTTLEVQPYVGTCLVVTQIDARSQMPSSRCAYSRQSTSTGYTESRSWLDSIIDSSGTQVRDESTNQITSSTDYIEPPAMRGWRITAYDQSYIREERGNPPRLKRIGQLTTTTVQQEICIIQYSHGGLIPRVYGRGLIQSYTRDYQPRRKPKQIDSYEDVFIDFVLTEAYILCSDGRFERFDFEPYAT